MTKEEKTIELFNSGYNCSQAVFTAFAADFGIDEKLAKSIATGLGGGVGRMREVCGAVSAAAMILGMKYGEDGSNKGLAYEKIQEFAARFKEESGSIICAERLGLREAPHNDPVPEKRTSEYYKKRPCSAICGDAARIVEEMLK